MHVCASQPFAGYLSNKANSRYSCAADAHQAQLTSFHHHEFNTSTYSHALPHLIQATTAGPGASEIYPDRAPCGGRELWWTGKSELDRENLCQSV